MRSPSAEELFPQDEREFALMLGHLQGCTSLLEIGSRFAVSLKRMALAMSPGSRIVTVDIGDDPLLPPGTRPSEYWAGTCDGLRAEGYEVHRIQGDSHDPSVIERVRALAPYDFGFIDADHETPAVRADWENYGPMCKVLAFHDISADCVKTVWNDAKGPRDHREYIFSSMGIGVLRADGGRL